MKKNPCTKDCPNRNATCHCTCERGKAYEEYNRERNRQIREAKNKDKAYRDYKHSEADKIYKHQKWSK